MIANQGCQYMDPQKVTFCSHVLVMAIFHDITPLKTGVALEVATSQPNQEHQCTRVAFCLHPWSRLGGCMYDP